MRPALAARFVFGALTLAAGCCIGPPSSSWCAETCARDGACSVRTERTGDSFYRCYAGSDAECAASQRCASEGRCAAAEDGTCVRREEVASRRCALSVECRSWGGCHAREGFCEPQSDADCRASLGCLAQGRCSYDDHHCYVGDDGDCARSAGCALEGLCTETAIPLIGASQCALGAAGDCRATLACTRDGRCTPRPMEGCSEGCRVFYCGYAASASAPVPCTELQGSALLACEPDGRCMRDARGECVHVP
jgi:hypothetical protein